MLNTKFSSEIAACYSGDLFSIAPPSLLQRCAEELPRLRDPTLNSSMTARDGMGWAVHCCPPPKLPEKGSKHTVTSFANYFLSFKLHSFFFPFICEYFT